MDYTLSNSYDADPATGLRMHEDAKAIPTVWSGKDANSIVWSLMAIVEAAGLPGIQFDKANPASYQQVLKAIRSLFASATVPTTFQGYEILVTEPHARKMVWNGTAYVRAPWHQPGMVLYSYHNPSSIPGYLPVRADLAYNQANYPDLVERLGLSGAGTFSLVELRGEFIRVLDNGRGINAGRVLRSAEAGDNRAHAHPVSDPTHAHHLNDPGHIHGAWVDAQGQHAHTLAGGGWTGARNNAPGNSGNTDVGSAIGQTTDPTGLHGHNVGIGAAATGAWLSGSGTGIGIGVDGSEARPRNVAFPAWISY